jgi:DNA repair protein RadC
MGKYLTNRGISSWPTSERPRERILRRGAQSLSVAELLAVCLGSGVAGEDAVGMARRLLTRFGGLDALLAATVEDLLQLHGLGDAKVALLKAIHELSMRNCEEEFAKPREQFADTDTVSRYIQKRIGHSDRELFGCLYLDSRHQLLSWVVLFYGSVDRAHVHAREVLKRGFELNAAALVLAHNHPSGVAEPSHADLLLTRELTELLQKVDIRVIDHIIVGRGCSVSLAHRGFIAAQ